MNKFLTLLLTYLMVVSPVFAGTTTFQTDKAQLGRPNSNNKDFLFNLNLGASNPLIRANGTTHQLSFSNDGTTFNAFGTGSGSGQGTNYLSDSNGQSYPTGTAWTVTAGTGSADTSNYTDSLQSIKVTASSQQSVLSQDVTPTTQLSGQQLQATMWVKTSLTNVQVCARVGGVEANCQPVSSANVWAPYTATMVGPASGSIGLEVSMTSSGTGTFNAQLAYVGKATSVAMLSQAQLIGGVKITGCATGWTTTSTSLTNFSAVSGCVYTTFGSAQAPSTNVPGLTFPSLPPGEYILQSEAISGNNTANKDMYLQFWDGTNTARELSAIGAAAAAPSFSNGIFETINYSTPQSNVTLQIRGYTDSGGTAQLLGTTALPAVIKVYYFPTQQQAGFRADATPASWSGYHANACAPFSATSSTFADLTTSQSGCALVERQNRNFGTVTSYGGTGTSAKPGIVATLPRAGRYQVCANMAVASSATTGSFQLVDGSSNVIAAQSFAQASAAIPMSICGIYNAAAAASTTIKLQAASASGSVTIPTPGALGDAVSWTIVELDAPMPAPYLTGSIASNTSATERLERSRVTNPSGTAAIATQSGSWVSSVSRTAAGDVVMTLAAGMFSAAPSCTASASNIGNNSFTVLCGIKSQPTTTSVEVVCSNLSSGTGNDATYDVLCMGPR